MTDRSREQAWKLKLFLKARVLCIGSTSHQPSVFEIGFLSGLELPIRVSWMAGKHRDLWVSVSLVWG